MFGTAWIHRLLQQKGYRLVRIPAESTGPDPAFAWNQPENADRFYADSGLKADYLSPDRLQFYRSLTAEAERLGTRWQGRTVLEAGCGMGHLLGYIQQHGQPASATGIEFSGVAVGIARQLFPQASFVHTDLLAYQPDRPFDLVVCAEVLEHMQRPQDGLRHLLQLTAPGGTLLLSVPNGRIDTFEGHIHFWSLASWQLWLADQLPGHRIATGYVPGMQGRYLYASIEKPGA